MLTEVGTFCGPLMISVLYANFVTRMRFLPRHSLCVALSHKDSEQERNALDGNPFGFQVTVFAKGESVEGGGLLLLVHRCTCFLPIQGVKERRQSVGGDLNLTVIRCDVRHGAKRASFDYS
jgi:hypothetical protein